MKKNDNAACITAISLVLIVMTWIPGAHATVKKVTATKVPEQKDVTTVSAELKAAPAYKYNPVGKPDPFKPYIVDEIATKKKLEMPKALPINPLQRAGIEQFKLVGVAIDEHSRIAMVTDVKGKFYPIFVGTYIGLHNGRVVEILQDRVIVEETIKAEAKHAKTKRVAIKLRKEEGEVKP
ncbi:MAG: pilus assembly protein PilP [Syntrophaceae bacterium]|nr:pilus assembly protein PilP [Syntrophaceae bacterium]